MKTSHCSLLAVSAMIFSLACQKTTVRKEMMAMGPVILPNQMCAPKGTVSMSTDVEGERMLCELQEQLGTHLPRCVCWDEGYSERERELAFEQMRNISSLQACGGTVCLPGAVGSTALGTK